MKPVNAGPGFVPRTLDNQPLQRWYVRKDSPYQSLADVAGARYAVNLWKSSFHYTALMGLNRAGIPEDAVDFRLLAFPDQIAALTRGEVDVIGLIPPYQGYLLAEHGGEVRELWNDYDLYGSKHVSLIFLNRVWARYNPDAAQAFVAAISEAITWAEANQAEAAQIVGKHTGIDPVRRG